MRVVVVGAGLAGLTAARVLIEAGCDVEVVEVGERVGGRARTVRACFTEGQFAESGAEWVDTTHSRMRALLDRYGLTLLGGGERWSNLRRSLHRNGVLLTAAELRLAEPGLNDEFDRFDAIVAEAAAGIVDASRPHDHPDAARIDSRSLADVAHEAGLGAVAQLFKRRDSQGEYAEEPHGVSLLFAAQQRAQADAASGAHELRSHRVTEGLDSLVQAMAAEVAGSIALGERLVGVDHTADVIMVRTTRRDIETDHLVLTCALPALRDVSFVPALPAALAHAVAELGYGTVTKTAVQFANRAWSAGYTTSDNMAQRAYEPTVDQVGSAGILMSYCGGDGGRALAELAEAERLQLIAAELQTMHNLDEPAIGGFSRAWSIAPFFGGSYACYRPGQVTAFWEVLRQPVGRVWLAGEHTATCTGYLEGAVEAAEMVSAAIIAHD